MQRDPQRIARAEAEAKPADGLCHAARRRPGRTHAGGLERQAKDAGIGIKRKADLTDIRNALLSRGMVRNYGDRWHVGSSRVVPVVRRLRLL